MLSQTKLRRFREGIIVFVGPPGAGKSTQIFLLMKLLSTLGLRVKTTNLKRGFIASIFEKILYVLIYYNRNRSYHYPYLLEILIRGAKDKLRKIILLWLVVNLIEIYVRSLLLWLMKAFRYIVFVEDYIPAIIIDYIYVVLKLEIQSKNTLKWLLILLFKLYSKIKPILLFYLTASLSVLIIRWHSRGRAECSRTYLQIYTLLPHIVKMMNNKLNVKLVFLDTTYQCMSESFLKIITYMLYAL